MIKIAPKCEKCGKSMREPILSDRTEDNFTQFKLVYCPRCIDLGDTVDAIVWGKTIHKK